MSPTERSRHLARIDPSFLEPEFLDKLSRLLDDVNRQKIPLKMACGLRHPQLQADLWCASRTREHIEVRMEGLEAAGAPRIASLLNPDLALSVTRALTTTLPGESWHQWGMAADLYIGVGLEAYFSSKAFLEVVRPAVFKAGLFFKKHVDVDVRWNVSSKHHVQLYEYPTRLEHPRLFETWAKLDEDLAKAFPDLDE